MVRRFIVRKTKSGRIISKKEVKSFKKKKSSRSSSKKIKTIKIDVDQFGGSVRSETVGGKTTITKTPRKKRRGGRRPSSIVNKIVAPKVTSKLIVKKRIIEPISTFRKSTTDLRDKLKVTSLKSSDKQLLQKVFNKQSLTPAQKKQASILSKKQGDLILKTQFLLFKNAPKDVALGVFEFGKELVTLSKNALVGSFNFGKNLRKRFEAGENNPLKNDVIKIAKGTVSVIKFVKNNPEIAAAIVGTAGVNLGKDFGTAFINNPVKTTTKAALYLFPATIIRGGIKAAGTTKKGLQSTAAAIKLSKLNKITSPVKASLTANQNARLVKSLPKISNLNKAAGEKKLIKVLRKFAKEQNIKIKRGSSSNQIMVQIPKQSKVIPVGTPLKKPIIRRVQPKKPFKTFTVKGKKVTKVISTVKGPVKKVPIKRDKSKFGIAIGKDIEKITKKQFKSFTKPTKKIKLDVRELSKAATKKLTRLNQNQLSRDGIIRIKKTTYIDLNAVKRIEKASTPLKPILKNKLLKSKKGALRFQQQIQIQTTKSIKKVAKIKKVKPTIAAKKKVISDLKKLKAIINAGNAQKIIRLLGLIKLIDAAIKEAQAVTPKQATTPAQKEKPAQKKTPALQEKFAQATDSAQKLKSPTKGKQLSKSVTKLKPRAKKPAKKKPPKALKFINRKLPKVPSGKLRSYKIEFVRPNKSNLVVTGLPINKAKREIRRFLLDKKQNIKSAFFFKSGITKEKDINQVNLNKFRVARFQAQNKVGFIVQPKK